MTMMPWTGLVTFVVVSFEDKEGDHAKVLEYVSTECKDAIECGLLVFRECHEMEFLGLQRCQEYEPQHCMGHLG